MSDAPVPPAPPGDTPPAPPAPATAHAADASAAAEWLLGERGGFCWYHVEDPKGPGLDRLAPLFGIHELAVEDCRDQATRAKLEQFDSHYFLVANTVHFDAEKCECWFGEFDIFAGKDFLISVHDGPSRTMRAVQPKFQTEARLAHPGRLLHRLLDVIVDRYLPVLDSIGDRITSLEQRVYEEASPEMLAEIFAVRRALVDFRRTALGMREVLGHLMRLSDQWIRSQQIYFRDVYDNLSRALEMVETYRDLVAGILEVHLTTTANRTNNIMKVLTVFATLALPFLMVTGFYGMNFENLPLLDNPYGFLIATGLMTSASVVLLLILRRRGWF
jgi:magnesium transporter